MKTALITGANSGIGYATALELARHGYRVMAGMRSTKRGSELLEAAVREQLPIEAITLDVTSDENCERSVATVLERYGAIDVLVNNAGVGIVGPVEDINLNEAREGFEINLFGAMRLIQLVLPGMRERKSGCIVNMSSIAGRFATGGQALYAGSKFALEATSEALAQEVRQFDIRVVIIEPGVTRTPALEKMPPLKPDSAYTAFLSRTGRALGARMGDAADPSLVARAIRIAIESPEYRLRHPVGNDTLAWIEGRSRLSDEEWVEYGLDMSDAELSEFWRKHFNLEV